MKYLSAEEKERLQNSDLLPLDWAEMLLTEINDLRSVVGIYKEALEFTNLALESAGFPTETKEYIWDAQKKIDSILSEKED